MPRLVVPMLISLLAALPARADEAARVVEAARGLVGTCSYSPASLAADKGFARADGNPIGAWARGQRTALPDRVNCWEMIYLAAAKAGVIGRGQVVAVQDKARRTASRQYARDLAKHGDAYRINLQLGAMFSANDKTVGPLGYYQARPYRKAAEVPARSVRPGDVVFFGASLMHAALALGTRDARGRPEVLSIDRDSRSVERTTIDALATRMRAERAPSVPVRIGRPDWGKLAGRARRGR